MPIRLIKRLPTDQPPRNALIEGFGMPPHGIDGGWGYTKQNACIILPTTELMPAAYRPNKEQLDFINKRTCLELRRHSPTTVLAGVYAKPILHELLEWRGRLFQRFICEVGELQGLHASQENRLGEDGTVFNREFWFDITDIRFDYYRRQTCSLKVLKHSIKSLSTEKVLGIVSITKNSYIFEGNPPNAVRAEFERVNKEGWKFIIPHHGAPTVISIDGQGGTLTGHDNLALISHCRKETDPQFWEKAIKYIRGLDWHVTPLDGSGI